MKHWIYFRKQAFPVLLALTAVLFLLTGCFGRSASEEEQEAEASAEEEQEEYEQAFDGDYPGTVAVREAAADEAPYYGIMYATILDINGSGMDSSTVYSFKDKNDPDNAWSVTGLEVGDIETELSAGTDVVILFHGDMVRDSENVEFLVILGDGTYELKRAAGVTTSNMMSTFTVETAAGSEIQLHKDNCRIDNGALTRDSGETVIVYYADGGELGCYPLRVYKGD